MKLTAKETAIFGVLGAMMYASKMVMEVLPNIHLVGVFVVAITLVYRKKALYPIYVYVFLSGLLSGFAGWWIPYLYIWTFLWGMTMLLPQKMPNKIKPLVYMCTCALHGMLYGVFYAPVHMVMYGLSFQGAIAWVLAGLPWDLTHCIGNLFGGLLICPIAALLKRLDQRESRVG